MSQPVFKRILLKLSGEALSGKQKTGLDDDFIVALGKEIKEVADMGVEIAIVVGGGNFWRGRTCGDMDRVTADHIGMLATTMNALALADGLERAGATARVMSSIEMRAIAEPYIRKRATRHLDKGRVVIFAGGTGNPFFSTDTGAALRAAEVNAEVILKATNVDGVYDKDPNKFADAVRYKHLTHDQVLQQKLGVMDAAAAALCRDNHIPIAVFNLRGGNIKKMLCGEDVGTLVTD